MNPHSPVIRLFCCRDCRISSKNRCVVGSEGRVLRITRKVRDDRVDFDRRVRLGFRALGSVRTAVCRRCASRMTRSGCPISPPAGARTRSTGSVFRQSVYGRLAGYEDVNDADRPALDRVNRPGALTNGTITSTMYNLLSVMSVERHPFLWP